MKRGRNKPREARIPPLSASSVIPRGQREGRDGGRGGKGGTVKMTIVIGYDCK